MASPRRKLEGRRFHKLVVIEWAEWRQYAGGRESAWRCRCDCGNETVTPQKNLVGGKAKSCGCIVGKHKRTHGGTGTSEYRIWSHMRRRCSDPGHVSYKDYGGRGIRVCDRWQDFANFLADMGPRPSPEHSIDRYPNNYGNYEPGNCRWATNVEQSNNRRSSRLLEFNGETKTLAEWERQVGLDPGDLHRRLKAGWPIDKALSPEIRRGCPTDLTFTHSGVTLTAVEWAQRLGISEAAFRQRTQDGLPPEKVFFPGPLPSMRFSKGENGRNTNPTR